MTVEVNARHKNISEAFREYARQRGEKIGEAFPMVESVRVVMDFQNKLCAAEIIAQRKDEMFVGTANTDTSMRAARTAKNMRTGETIQVPATKVPRFKAGKTLKDAVK